MLPRCLVLFAVPLAIACVTETPAAPNPDALPGPKKYIVSLEGRNYIMESDGEPTRFGFFTTRHVVATSSEEAAQRAIDSVRADAELNASLLNAPEDPPRVAVTKQVVVESFDVDHSPELGYIFYEDHETR